jgi:uridine phosphorylase
VTLIVACGLKREARLIDRPGRDVAVVIGGGDAVRLEAELMDRAERSPGLILSCGIAGALASSLKTGDVVIDGDPAVLAVLQRALPQAVAGRVFGSDAIIATAALKLALAAHEHAIAADMETHVVQRVARAKGLPFGAIRVISDGATDDLPPAALVGMRPDGGTALGAVLASLARRPGQLPALMRTGRQAGVAFRGLGEAFDAVVRAGIDKHNIADL